MIDKEKLNELRDRAFSIAKAHGFHDEKKSDKHWKCLIVSELMEAVEADRNSSHADMDAFETRVATHPDFVEQFEAYVKDTVEDGLADAVIRILDFAGTAGDNIGEFYKEVKVTSKEFIQPIKDEFCRCTELTESIYIIVEDLITAGCDFALFDLFLLADTIGFDLLRHIELKMEYNQSRERLHGKKY